MFCVRLFSFQFLHSSSFFFFFFFNHTATTEIYTLSLHDALPIFTDLDAVPVHQASLSDLLRIDERAVGAGQIEDRKSTRLNSSHRCISYAVFCLKKKKNI